MNTHLNPAVTVVIPTYNHAPFLRQALRSVVEQSFTDWEAIVVNNHSTDNTVEVVESFEDPRIRLVNFHNHGVIAASRNEGIRLAKADFIAFLDSDDTWINEKLTKCIAAMNSDVDLVCHGELWMDDRGLVREVLYGPVEKSDYESLLYEGNCLSTSAVLVRKSDLENVGGFRENQEFVTAEDYDLWMRLARNGCRFRFVEDVLGTYRLHQENESRNILRHVNAVIAVLESHFSEVRATGRRKSLERRRLSRAYFSAAYSAFKAGDLFLSVRLFWVSFCKSPIMVPSRLVARGRR